MFREALALASEFTLPVILSRRTVGGMCSSSLGTFVVVNRDGWIVTAGHILRQWVKLMESVAVTVAAQAERAVVEKDVSLTKRERAIKLSNIVVGRNDSDRCSAFWGMAGWTIQDTLYCDVEMPNFGEVADIGVGRLVGFDPAAIKKYPVFKDPTKNFEPGVSLCKLGFPFHECTPTWNAATESFELPPHTFPMPRFPLEGMFTRINEILIESDPKPPFPIRYVETSTPGLRGQSGGPTFDTKGTVWAIQAKTSHLPLGFDGQKQFLNVGLGVHPETLFPLFDQAGVKYQISDY
jgi:hypothetical protein